MRSLLTLLPPPLVLIIAAALGFVWHETRMDTGSHESGRSTPADTQGDVVQDPEGPGTTLELLKPEDRAADLKFARERPLFSETRRRPVPPPPPNEAIAEPEIDVPEPEPRPEPEPNAPPPRPRIAIVGYVDTADGQQALILLGQNKTEKWVRVGDQVDEWTVTRITNADVKLEHLEFELIVEFKR